MPDSYYPRHGEQSPSDDDIRIARLEDTLAQTRIERVKLAAELELVRLQLREARAEVERLRAALEKVMLCSHPPTGKACNCFRQGDAALRRSTPLVTEGDK